MGASVQKSDRAIKKRVKYSYDALNRIATATANSANYHLSGVSYDKNGNILTLQRQGHTNANATLFGTMDDLVYTYDSGNKLTKVLDNGNDTYGFVDGANSVNEYSYDTNGNLTSDANKGITSVTYNHMNMPTNIVVSNSEHNGNLEYVYAANRAKIRKINSNGTTTDYAGKYVYENGNLKQISHPEGYIEPDGSGWQYVYYLKDHLKNVRITFADDNNDGSVNSTEIRKERNFYPFGLEHRGYNNSSYGAENNIKQYQGQEFTKDLGLNIHEWKYRFSDAAIGRFWQIDPLAEDYVYNGTYNFSENMVTTHVELEGKEAKYFMIDFNAENPQLEHYKTVDYWLIPNSMEPDVISVEALGVNLTYTFTAVGQGSYADCAGCGTGNNLDQFEAFSKDPIGAIYSGEYVTDQAIMSDAVKDLVIAAVLSRVTRTSVPRRGTPSMTVANQTKGWKVGDPINNLTSQGNVPKWSTVRQRYWKNRANGAADGNFSKENLARMKKGLAPQRLNPETGKMESMELDHKPPQRDGGLFDFEEVWPDEHAAQDPYRHTGN